MDTLAIPPDHSSATYALWHIPSSSLLLSSTSRDAVALRLRLALADGVPLEDLMLQVTRPGSLVGRQFLGRHIAEAVDVAGGPPDTAFASA